MPGVGGDFVYLSRAYGKTASFAFAWYYFWISKPGTQAMVASVFGSYFVTIFTGLENADETSAASKAAAVLLIILLTLLNCFGIMEALFIVRFFTFVKLTLVATILVSTVAYLSSHSVRSSFLPPPRLTHCSEDLYPSNSFQGTDRFNIGQALMACLWAFEGWADLNFLSEELINYEKNVGPLCISAILIVSSCFLIINVSYFIVLDQHKIVHSDAVAIDFGQAITSSNILPYYLVISVALSAAGAANSLIITGGRAFYAIAQSNQAPHIMGRLNYAGVPAISLVAQGMWAIVLVLLPGSSFQSLLQYMGPASWLFYALSCCAVIRLRITEPKLHRPFRVPFYPLPPLIIVGVSFYLLANTLSKEPFFCFLSLGFIALSFPAWWIIKRYNILPQDDKEGDGLGGDTLGHSLILHNHNPRTLSNGFF